MTNNEKLREAKYFLLKNYPFYYGLYMQCKIELDENFPHIAGVLVKTRMHMKINPKEFFALPIKEQAGILVHEFQHVIKGHIKQSLDKYPQSIAKSHNKEYSHQVVNIAMDAEINPGIGELANSKVIGPESKGPMKIVHPSQFDCPTNEVWSKYYEYLLKNEDKYIQKIKAPGNADGEGDISQHQDHSYFEECEEYKDFHDHVVAKSIERTKIYGNRHIPKEAQDFLDEYLKGKPLPWATILRKLLRNMVSIEQKSTWKKRSRRFGYKTPGVVKPPRMKLLVGLDASGSVPDDEFAIFFNEIDAISKAGNIEVWVAEFDTEVSNYYKYTGTPKPRSAYGGTNFIPVHKKVIEKNFQTLVMLTDGYGPFADPSEVKYNSIWVMTSSEKAPYGMTINIDSKG